MTEEKLNVEVEEVENEEVEEEVELGFIKEITLVNAQGAKRVITAPEHVPGTVYKEAVKVQFAEQDLSYKKDDKGNFVRDEDGNLIPIESSYELEMKTADMYEELVVLYFNKQFTKEELVEGLDARMYMETLAKVFMSALGNRIPLVKK